MPADTEVLIVELAMRARGEIAALTKVALPDVGVIVNAGVAHLALLLTVDNIIAAKCEMLEVMNGGGTAVIGQPTGSLLARAGAVFHGKLLAFDEKTLSEVEVTPELTVFELPAQLTPSGAVRFTVHAHGVSHLQDAWCAIAAARECGLDDAEIARGLAAYRPVSGRGNQVWMDNGCLVVDEAYNGNPDSVRCSVAAFVDGRAFPQDKKYVVLGELAELGEQTAELHRSLGQWLSAQDLAGLITVGPVAHDIAEGARGAGFEVVSCPDQNEAEQVLRARLTGSASVLIKGSHCANLDKLVAKLVAVPAQQ